MSCLVSWVFKKRFTENFMMNIFSSLKSKLLCVLIVSAVRCALSPQPSTLQSKQVSADSLISPFGRGKRQERQLTAFILTISL